MKEYGIKIDHDIYTVLTKIRDQSQLDLAKEAITEIDASGYKDKAPETDYPSFFFEPIPESAGIEL